MGILTLKIVDDEIEFANNTLTQITGEDALKQFDKLWRDRRKIDSSECPDFTHKVDIATPRRSTRWLFHPEGYATVLSKARLPVYRFSQPRQLRDMLLPPDDGVRPRSGAAQ